jgi:mannose-1-phosphate guanylyltransferase/phosphomannomutase
MEYAVELLRTHGITDIVVTLAFLPKLVRGYFDDGSALGVHMEYSIEEAPMGTAGSVKLAEDNLRGDTFVVISGDALTDFDLTDLISYHRSKGAMVTIALKRVANPLEFGVVVINDDGRIERFLEKPTWGQVFSDTVNTGIYVIEPEVLDHIPVGEPYDFSQDLFPKLFSMGAPLFGHVAEGYWQDIGSLQQFLAANRDLLDGKVKASLPGMKLDGQVRVGENVTLESLENVRGPAFLGNYSKIDRDARIQPYTVLGSNVVVKGHSELGNCVLDANTYVGSSSVLRGTIVGKNCDIKAGVVLSEGSAIGDECVIGEQAYVGPNVKIYPFKTVDSGAQVQSSIIWESRGTSQLFGKDGVVGLTNVDITAELGLKLAMAYGTILHKGDVVMTSRDADPASRILKRAIISGLNSTGVTVRDLRICSPAVNRHEIKVGNAQGGVHVRVAGWDPEMLQIQVFEPPGIPLRESTQKAIERYYGREDFRRAYYTELGEIDFPDRAVETYLRALRNACNEEVIARRRFRFVIDYASSPPAIIQQFMAAVRAETVSMNTVTGRARRGEPFNAGAIISGVQRMVEAMGADLGVVFDPAAELMYLVDERGEEVPQEKALLLFVKLVCERYSGSGARLALPLTVTRSADTLAAAAGVEVVRTKVSLSALTEAASAEGVVFAGGNSGGYIFPQFVCAYDAVMSLAKLLELLAPHKEPLSRIIAELPRSTLVHKTAGCPWALKGTVMRTLTEEMQRAEEGEVGLIDGVRLSTDGRWVQIIPDSDEPVFHIYAEAETAAASAELADSYVRRVRGVVENRE